jgi:hypothetical protein
MKTMTNTQVNGKRWYLCILRILRKRCKRLFNTEYTPFTPFPILPNYQTG